MSHARSSSLRRARRAIRGARRAQDRRTHRRDRSSLGDVRLRFGSSRRAMWALIDTQQSAPLPPLREQPRSRRGYGRRSPQGILCSCASSRMQTPKAVKVVNRRKWIRPIPRRRGSYLREISAIIVDDVQQRPAHLERRAQRACVVPVCENMAARMQGSAKEALLVETLIGCRPDRLLPL